MEAPALIPYNDFIANVTTDDLRSLAFLAAGDVLRTPDAAEADVFQAQGVRLYDAGLLLRFRRGLEVINNETWHTFDGLLKPQALPYVAQCASERVMLSRDPIPPQQ